LTRQTSGFTFLENLVRYKQFFEGDNKMKAVLDKPPCDNFSVGVVVEAVIRGVRRFLMIFRGNYPRCIAFPAGHLDGGEYPVKALAEVLEETGVELWMRDLYMVYEGVIANPCKRDGGVRHDWRAYRYHGQPENLILKAGDDAKKAFCASEEELRYWAVRTEFFFSKLGLNWIEVGTLTLKIFGDPKTGPVTEEERALYADWQKDPGLEPVWYFMLRMSGFFDWTFQNAPVFAKK
jgi:ADP-ribose pyrophosphatase YjhB (NUDIX family)